MSVSNLGLRSSVCSYLSLCSPEIDTWSRVNSTCSLRKSWTRWSTARRTASTNPHAHTQKGKKKKKTKQACCCLWVRFHNRPSVFNEEHHEQCFYEHTHAFVIKTKDSCSKPHLLTDFSGLTIGIICFTWYAPWWKLTSPTGPGTQLMDYGPWRELQSRAQVPSGQPHSYAYLCS